MSLDLRRLAARWVGRATAIWWRFRSGGRIRGDNFRIKRPHNLRVTGHLSIGTSTVIDAGSSIRVSGNVSIGSNSYIGRGFTLVSYPGGEIEIGSGVLVGERVSMHGEDHGPPGDRQRFRCSPIRVGDTAWICAGAVVTRGVSIGEASTIGANAVVIRDVPVGALAAGVPARVIRADASSGSAD